MIQNKRLILIVNSILVLLHSSAQFASSHDGANAKPSALWLSNSSLDLKLSDKLSKILDRVGPNMRASADYHDFTDIQLKESIEAWTILHERAKLFAQNQVHYYAPKVEQLMRDANVTQSCLESIRLTLNSMAKLDTWAIQTNFQLQIVWSATGNFPPSSMLDGQFSDPGSYRGCLDTIATPGTIGHTNYCTLAFRPIVPTRQRFHMIFWEEKQLLELFDRADVFSELAHRAQFFHYIYLRTGICVPAQCSAEDIQQVASLVGRRLMLTAGPVKCFTKASVITASDRSEVQYDQIEDKPIQVDVTAPMNKKQMISLVAVIIFFSLVFVASIWHLAEIGLRHAVERQQEFDLDEKGEHSQERVCPPVEYKGIRHIAFDYFSVLTNGCEFMDTSMRQNEIKCLHGLRVITMAWIICVHTLQYNEWSGFTRVFQIVNTLQNPALHPIYNANYVVDNFFFMSGLLAAYTTWYNNRGSSFNFSVASSLVGRYLRLTPQVLLVSLLYILLPLAGDSPFWYDMTHHAAKYCERNWWVNLLHIQAFYREDEICNLVGWWISVDMLYYALALGLIYMILNNHLKRALLSTVYLVGTCMIISAYRHYYGGYTPNNLGTVPQVSEVWTWYVVNFFWSPFPHAYPFYSGLWAGYVLANNKWRNEVRRWSRLGWAISMLSLFSVAMSSYVWMSGAVELGNQLVSTAYNNVCTVIWASAFAWVVMACHYGCAPALDRLLSLKVFVLVSKASFIIYLSHMLLVRMFFGYQNALLEVSVSALTYIVLGNIILSTIFGIFLSITFEGPCMKFQKLVTRTINPGRKTVTAGANYPTEVNSQGKDHKMTIESGPTCRALLK